MTHTQEQEGRYMKYADVKIHSKKGTYLDYGFGLYGFGLYVWYQNILILFIRDKETK